MAFDPVEFRQYLDIDKRALDDAVIQQPALFEQVCEALAEANSKRDIAKEQLLTVDAELDLGIRVELEKKGVKATEGQIKARIQTNRSHELAFSEQLRAKERADKLFGLKEAFQQRSESLKNLARLYTANYFEEASVRGNSASDNMAYSERRKKLAEARQRRSAE